MERPRDYEEIATALAEMRPVARSEFAAELDEWAAAGFPRRSTTRRRPLAALAALLSGSTPRARSLAVAATALTAIAVATVVIASDEPNSERVALDSASQGRPHRAQFSESVPRAASPSVAPAEGNSSSVQYSSALPSLKPFRRSSGPGLSAGLASLEAGLASRGRKIEHAAQIGLLAEPDDVAEDSAQVFAAVHDAGGIVLRSTTASGHRAGAHFDLLIPSPRLGDALAAFSAIDQVRTRHEATADITKPTVSLEETLRDSRAAIDGLLSELASAETESEREAIEGELARERRHAARLRAQLDRLEQRVDYSRVSVRIEASAGSTESGWGVDDAFGDAGHILGIAAGVTLVGLAVIAPLALIGLLIWLAHRAWLRRARDRALA